MTRRRLGSFNSKGDPNNNSRDDKLSPDITPNGTLRRRRSRVLSEEDEDNLMEFLRASGQDVSVKERKSWGSLDRSWARRARGGSTTRKRPALLGIDLSGDRERPTSPSPLSENKMIIPVENNQVESKPREWRQKIESWLQANEKDEITDEQRRQIRARGSPSVLVNRRSLEMDSGTFKGHHSKVSGLILFFDYRKRTQ